MQYPDLDGVLRMRRQGDETGDSRDDARRERSERRTRTPHAAPRAESQDPFFSQPYSATPAAADEAPPAWDTPQRQRTGRSANIKPKRTVAALLKAAAPVSQ